MKQSSDRTNKMSCIEFWLIFYQFGKNSFCTLSKLLEVLHCLLFPQWSPKERSPVVTQCSDQFHHREVLIIWQFFLKGWWGNICRQFFWTKILWWKFDIIDHECQTLYIHWLVILSKNSCNLVPMSGNETANDLLQDRKPVSGKISTIQCLWVLIEGWMQVIWLNLWPLMPEPSISTLSCPPEGLGLIVLTL